MHPILHSLQSDRIIKYSSDARRLLALVQGVQKKMSHSFCLISLATNMLESWDITHWKGGIHSFIWSTKTFLYNIRELRYKQIKMEYQISKCLNIEKSSVWKSDTAAIYA